MSWQYSWYFSEPRQPNRPLPMISEKPMMALSGVRSSWLMLARNFDLVWLASSARVFSSAYFCARSASSAACCFSVAWVRLRSITVARSRRSLSTSLRSCSLMRVMSVPTDT